MAIKLNTPIKVPDFDKDKYLTKYIKRTFKFAPEYDSFKLRELADKMDLKYKRVIYGTIQNDISDYLIRNGFAEIKYGETLTLTEKGRDKKNGTEQWNRITKYQMIYLLFFIPVAILSISNHFLPPFSRSDFQELQRDFDSLNQRFFLNNKKLEQKLKPIENDTSLPKNYPDSKNEKD